MASTLKNAIHCFRNELSGGDTHMKRQAILVRRYELDSYGRLIWKLLELHKNSKRYYLK